MENIGERKRKRAETGSTTGQRKRKIKTRKRNKDVWEVGTGRAGEGERSLRLSCEAKIYCSLPPQEKRKKDREDQGPCFRSGYWPVLPFSRYKREKEREWWDGMERQRKRKEKEIKRSILLTSMNICVGVNSTCATMSKLILLVYFNNRLSSIIYDRVSF